MQGFIGKWDLHMVCSDAKVTISIPYLILFCNKSLPRAIFFFLSLTASVLLITLTAKMKP